MAPVSLMNLQLCRPDARSPFKRDPFHYGQWPGGSPAAGHFSCAAKKSNQKKAAPGVALRVFYH